MFNVNSRRVFMKNRLSKRKRRFFRPVLILSTVCAMTLAGCAAEPPQPVAVATTPMVGTVNVIESSIANPAVSLPNCHFQGKVLVRTVDNVKPVNLVITETEMVELKHKTTLLNANTAVVRQNHLVTHRGMFVHLIEADAYTCYSSGY